MSSSFLLGSGPGKVEVLYCPAGVKSKLPSGANDSLRKNDVKVSLAYRFALRTSTPKLPETLGDAEGITAGSGIDGLGDTERRTVIPVPICEPNEDLRLWEVGGGFIGRARDCGVPGAEGAGDPTTA